MSTSNLTRSPKEGHHRPSINVTFRSAALAYESRVIGGVLSGALDDGCAGLWEIKARGGLAVVQDPDDALFPSMPRNALLQVPVDFTASISEIPALLARLCKGQAMEEHLHKNLEAPEGGGLSWLHLPGVPLPFIGNAARSGGVSLPSRAYVFDADVAGWQRVCPRTKVVGGNRSAGRRADISEFAASRTEARKREELMEKAEQLRRRAGSVREILQEIPPITLD